MEIDRGTEVEKDTVPAGVRNPIEAYLYLPKGNEIKIKSGKAGIRRIFDGNTGLDEFELGMVNEFKIFLSKSKLAGSIDYSYWNEAKILRFLQANHFKMEKTMKTIIEHQNWRLKSLPARKTDEIEKFLNSGLMYIHGRDNRFRPIIIFNIYKIDLKKQVKEIEIINGITYLLEYLLCHMLLPGQVENWVIIMDLNFIGVSSLPLDSLKNIMGFLQNTYRSRLFTLYCIKATSMIYVPWRMIKGLLEENTVNKVKILKTATAPELFDHTNSEQVEERFGGSAPNITSFWPPTVPSNKFFVKNDNASEILMTTEEYKKRFNNGELLGKDINYDILNDSLIAKPEMQVPVENKKEMLSPPPIIKPMPQVEFKHLRSISMDDEDFSATQENIDIQNIANFNFSPMPKCYQNDFMKQSEAFTSSDKNENDQKNKVKMTRSVMGFNEFVLELKK